MKDEMTAELIELINTAIQLDQTGLIILQSNADVLLARDKLTRCEDKEQKCPVISL